MPFSPKQEKALSALLSSATYADAAAKVGVSERTVQRWMADPVFSAAYAELRRGLVNQALDLLVKNALQAAGRLVELNDSPHPGVQLRAVLATLTLAREHSALAGIEQRLAALESPHGYQSDAYSAEGAGAAPDEADS
jgi:hypothetical protein